jgi:hypothetical protein
LAEKLVPCEGSSLVACRVGRMLGCKSSLESLKNCRKYFSSCSNKKKHFYLIFLSERTVCPSAQLNGSLIKKTFWIEWTIILG